MDIPVIQSKQGSVGISYQKSSWLVNAVGFYKEVDGITTNQESSGLQELINIIDNKNEKNKNPIICTCNSIKNKKNTKVLNFGLVYNGNTWRVFG